MLIELMKKKRIEKYKTFTMIGVLNLGISSQNDGIFENLSFCHYHSNIFQIKVFFLKSWIFFIAETLFSESNK